MYNETKCDFYTLREKFVSLHPVDVWKSDGFFDDADLMEINCHWLQFKPIRRSIHFSLAVLLAVLFSIGFFSNVGAIYILLR